MAPRVAAGTRPGCLARQREGKAWLQPGLAGGQSGGWMGGPGSMLPIGCLRLPPRPPLEPVAPRPASASPAASKLPEPAPPAGPCRAATGSGWPLPWTCLRSSSPCWSTLCLGQRRGQVGTEVAGIGWPPRCPRGGGQPQTQWQDRHLQPSEGPWQGSIDPGSLPEQEEGLGCRERHGGRAAATRGLPLRLLAGRSHQCMATDRCGLTWAESRTRGPC